MAMLPGWRWRCHGGSSGGLHWRGDEEGELGGGRTRPDHVIAYRAQGVVGSREEGRCLHVKPWDVVVVPVLTLPVGFLLVFQVN